MFGWFKKKKCCSCPLNFYGLGLRKLEDWDIGGIHGVVQDLFIDIGSISIIVGGTRLYISPDCNILYNFNCEFVDKDRNYILGKKLVSIIQLWEKADESSLDLVFILKDEAGTFSESVIRIHCYGLVEILHMSFYRLVT